MQVILAGNHSICAACDDGDIVQSMATSVFKRVFFQVASAGALFYLSSRIVGLAQNRDISK